MYGKGWSCMVRDGHVWYGYVWYGSCVQMSKTFDPFMFLSLPLPVKKIRTIMVNLVTVDPAATPTTVRDRWVWSEVWSVVIVVCSAVQTDGPQERNSWRLEGRTAEVIWCPNSPGGCGS